MSDYASLLRETEEAIGAGQEAHRQAQQVLDSLHLDHDRLLILALFFLLAGEKSDNGLMLALLYLFL